VTVGGVVDDVVDGPCVGTVAVALAVAVPLGFLVGLDAPEVLVGALAQSFLAAGRTSSVGKVSV